MNEHVVWVCRCVGVWVVVMVMDVCVDESKWLTWCVGYSKIPTQQHGEDDLTYLSSAA